MQVQLIALPGKLKSQIMILEDAGWVLILRVEFQ